VESSETLATIAEIAVAIAGFSTIFVGLSGRGARAWTRLEALNLRILLQVSALAVLFSLVPMVADRALEPSQVWVVSGALYGVGHLVDVSSFVFRMPIEASPINRGTGYAGFGIALVQIASVVFGSASTVEWIYLSVLIWHLAVAATGFGVLIFASQGQERA
jgi:hypothetical protein